MFDSFCICFRKLTSYANGQIPAVTGTASLPEDYVQYLPPGTFTNSSLERYFNSIERASKDLGSQTFEPVPDLHAEFKGLTLFDKDVDVKGQALSCHITTETQENKKILNLQETDGKILQPFQDHSKITEDDDLFTKVTSIVDEMQPGGLTERLNNLGIDFNFLKKEETSGSTDDLEKVAKPDGASKVKDIMAKICPECCKPNKKYVTWCIECGCVLIGVEIVTLKPQVSTNEPHFRDQHRNLLEQDQTNQHQENYHRNLVKHQNGTYTGHGQGLQTWESGRHFQERLEKAWTSESLGASTKPA